MDEQKPLEDHPSRNQTTEMTQKVFPAVDLVDFQKVSMSVNSIVAIIGLVAGAYYFFKRLKVEKDRDRISRIREHAKILLDYIDDYDKTVMSAINAQAIKLIAKRRREELVRLFQCLQHFLEANQALFLFSERELKQLQEFHSIIDNSKLMRGNLANGSSVGLRSQYVRALKDARSVCWNKLS